MKLIRILLLLTVISLETEAQNILTVQLNAIRDNDVINRQEVDCVEPGLDGQDLVWDFSKVNVLQKKCAIEYYSDSNAVILGIDGQSIQKFKLSNDSLFVVGYEDPLNIITYHRPMTAMAFPMVFGSKTSEAFYEGRGLYCNRNAIETVGTVNIEADASGMIILSDKDTLKNVLRIHTLRTSSIGVEKDNLIRDTTQRHMEIVDTYQWYARGYRYPVFETKTISTYHNTNHVSSSKKAYRYMPDEQLLLNDSLNREIAHNDSVINMEGDRSIIDFHVDTHGKVVVMTYTLTKSASVMTMVTNIMGMVLRREKQTRPAGEVCTMELDCNSLRKGEYIFYINVNGQTCSQKIYLTD